MNIKTIIREEIDDFDWIREIPSGVSLVYNKKYVIDCCESGYDEETVRHKLDELTISSGSHKSYTNWFNNTYIREVNHKCFLFFTIVKNHYDLPRIDCGWDRCEQSPIYEKFKKLSLTEFLNSHISTHGK